MNNKARKRNIRVAAQKVSSWIAELQAAKTTPHGLTDDVLIHALEGYGDADLSWTEISSRAQKFYKHISAEVSDCTIRRAFRRPVGTKKAPCAAVSVFRLMAAPLRQAETLFNASIFTFVFKPSGVWFLTATDALYTTDHLHQRIVERSAVRHQSLSQSQDDLSLLWPTFVELGQHRRQQGRRANVAEFITPWSDGLIFGSIEKFDGPVELLAPEVIEFSNGSGIKRRLSDYYRSGNERMVVVVRTFVGGDQLKDTQRRLKLRLENFIRRFPDALTCLMLRSRITVDEPYGTTLTDLFVSTHLRKANIPNALAELEEIIMSQDWQDEISRSVENRSRRKNQVS